MEEIKSYLETLTCKSGNMITLVFGKKLDTNIFNVKQANLKNGINLIPLITSIFEKKPHIYHQNSKYHLDKIQIHTCDLINGKKSIKTFVNTLVEHNIVSLSNDKLSIHSLSNNDILVKFNKYSKISNNYFSNCQIYNNCDNLTKVVWEWANLEFEIELDLYDNYYVFSIKISLYENVVMIPKRKSQIWNLLDLLEKLLSYLNLNSNGK